MSVEYAVHPAAGLFPVLDEPGITQLAADITDNGLLEPVWLYQDPDAGTVLLDGRNRVAACRLAGVEVDSRFYTGDDPLSFSISQNMMRRHLTPGQKAGVAARAEPLYAAQAKQRSGGRPRKDAAKPVADLPQVISPTPDLDQPAAKPPKKRAPLARDLAAAATGASGRGTAQFKRVEQKAPDLAAQVMAGAMALDRAERVVRDRQAEADRVAQAKLDAESQESPTMMALM